MDCGDSDKLAEMRAGEIENFRELFKDYPIDRGKVLISDRWIPGPEGESDVRIRIYEPREQKGIIPGILYIHGGGYVIGTPQTEDTRCMEYVVEVGCMVVSVDYRLAPEYPYPAALEDCYASLKWFYESASELNVDPSRIALVGPSAGGGLVAALSLLARDRSGPEIAFQMPLYPMLDFRNITFSSLEFTDGRIYNRESNVRCWEAYLGGDMNEEVSPYASPAVAEDLSGLPPTYTFVGELEPFRDETIEYVMRLSQAGVPTEFHLYPGVIHAFEDIIPMADISRRAVKERLEVMKRAFRNAR